MLLDTPTCNFDWNAPDIALYDPLEALFHEAALWETGVVNRFHL